MKHIYIDEFDFIRELKAKLTNNINYLLPDHERFDVENLVRKTVYI